MGHILETCPCPGITDSARLMANPTEYKTVQARILAYAEEIGWSYVPRAKAEERRGFDSDGATPEDRARLASLYFGDLLHSQVVAFNPK